MKELIIIVENQEAAKVASAVKKLKGVQSVKRTKSAPDAEYWILPHGKKPTRAESEREAKRSEASPALSLTAAKRWFERKTAKRI